MRYFKPSHDQQGFLGTAKNMTERTEERLLTVLSGPAGTGKSTLMKMVLAYLKDAGLPYVLTATTHQAAKVLTKVAGADAVTIHKALSLVPKKNFGTGESELVYKSKVDSYPKGTFLIVDEGSMISRELLSYISKWWKRTEASKVIIIGDSYQLPPVGETVPPIFAEDLKLPVGYLTEVHRQAGDNPLLGVATRYREILDGKPIPYLETSTIANGDGVVSYDSRKEWSEELIERYRYMQSIGRLSDIATVVHRNDAVHRLNRKIRNALFEKAPEKHIISGELLVANEAVTRWNKEKRREVVILSNNTLLNVKTSLPSTLYGVAGHIVRVVPVGEEGTYTFFVATDPKEVKAVIDPYRKKAMLATRVHKNPPDDDDRTDRVRYNERKSAWRDFFAIQREFTDLRHGYAGTVYKVQGTTVEEIFIDANDFRTCRPIDNDMRARLMYVALTRPRKVAHVLGQLVSKQRKEAA